MTVPTTSATAAFVAALQAQATLFSRPVVCGAPSYRKPARGSTSYKVPPTCSAAYRYPTTRTSPASGAFSIPPPDPIYASYPTTTPATDLTSEIDNVILNANGGARRSRLVLGPSIADGSIIASCHVDQDRTTARPIVICLLTPAGSVTFNMMANRHFGQAIADDLDGTVLSAPIIEASNRR